MLINNILKLLSNKTICIMRITTTYFGPMELKNLYITTSRDQQRMYCTCLHPPKLQLTTGYCYYGAGAHVHTLTFSSANYSS